jgi:hypothetical protein
MQESLSRCSPQINSLLEVEMGVISPVVATAATSQEVVMAAMDLHSTNDAFINMYDLIVKRVGIFC